MKVRGIFLLAGVCAALALACSATGSGNDDADPTGTGGGGGTGGAGGSAAEDGGFSLDAGDPYNLVIEPKDIVLTIVNGAITPQPFTATKGSTDVTTQAHWEFDKIELGDVDSDGVFTPGGKNGGVGTLRATYNTIIATTTVSIKIIKEVNSGAVTPADIAALDAASDVDPAMQVVYPYDDTLFPLGVLPPELQWNNVGSGNKYRLRLTETWYEYTEYFQKTTPARHLIAEEDWAAITVSGAGPQSDPLKVELQRFDGVKAYLPEKFTWRVARAKLRGSVYYWELPLGAGNGRILRINPGSDQVDEFFKPGDCWGCHTVSRDGKTVAAEFVNGNGPLYTVDVSVNPAVYGSISPAKPAGNFIFSAYNEKGDKLLVSDNTAQSPPVAHLKILDSQSGAVLVNNVLGNGCGEPAWSPDGKRIAATCAYQGGGWTFDATAANLTVAEMAPDGVTVLGKQVIVPTASQSQSGWRPAYPNFSPGGEWIVYGRPTFGSRSTENGTLWLIKSDGSVEMRLANADSDEKSFNPTFAPLRAGGYFWIVFITRRDYGNKMVGMNNQQLWATAIADPPVGPDPSHPPFYLRGQEMNQKSENAYWALDPCKEKGEGCEAGFDCCDGFCQWDQQKQGYYCGTNPGDCAQNGNACQEDGDCCESTAKCIDGYCMPPPPT